MARFRKNDFFKWTQCFIVLKCKRFEVPIRFEGTFCR